MFISAIKMWHLLWYHLRSVSAVLTSSWNAGKFCMMTRMCSELQHELSGAWKHQQSRFWWLYLPVWMCLEWPDPLQNKNCAHFLLSYDDRKRILSLTDIFNQASLLASPQQVSRYLPPMPNPKKPSKVNKYDQSAYDTLTYEWWWLTDSFHSNIQL